MATRVSFRRQLGEIQDSAVVMGSAVANAVVRSVEALKTHDLNLARQVIADDSKVDARRHAIESECIQLIATQQPMASDLRVIVAVLHIATELERIGDYAMGIARIVILMGDEPPLKPLIDIPRMTERAVDMLERSLAAFGDMDLQAARAVMRDDELVDALYDQIFRELVVFMAEDQRTITRATRLIWVAHNLERVADRVTNICERCVFVVTGKMEELGGSRY